MSAQSKVPTGHHSAPRGTRRRIVGFVTALLVTVGLMAPAAASATPDDVTPIVTTTTLTISPLDPAGNRPAFTDITYTATVKPAMAGIPVNFLTIGFTGSTVFGTAMTDENGVATVTSRTGALNPLPVLFAAKVETTDPNIFSSTSSLILSSVGMRYASAVVTTPATARMTETATSMNIIFPGAPDELAGSSISVYRGFTLLATEVVAQHDGHLRADFQIPAPAAPGTDLLNFRITSAPSSIVTVFTYTTPTVWTLAPQNLDIEVFPSVDAMTSMPIAATVTDDGAPVAGRDLTLNVYGVDGGLPLFTTDLTTGAEGAAGAMVPALPVGTYRVAITAAATSVYDALSESVTYDVVPIASATTLTVSPTAVHGSDRTFTATIDGDNPTGVVEFHNGSGVVGTVAVVDGSASLTLNTLDVGDHTIVAIYRGDSRHTASEDSVTASVVAWSSVVTTTLSATEVFVDETVDMHVTVALINPEASTFSRAIALAGAAADGTIELLVDGQIVGSPVALVNGAAVLTVPTATAGEYDLAARFTPATATATGSDSAVTTLTVAVPTVTPESPTPTPAATPTAAQTPAPAPLAATGADVQPGLLLGGILLFVVGAALAAGRIVRRQRA